MLKVLTLAEKYTLYIVIFLLPLILSSTFPDFFTLPKIIVLVGGLLLVILLKAAKVIVSGKLDLATSPFDVSLIVLALATLLSGLYMSPNKAEAFFLPGVATVLISGVVFYLFLNTISEKKTLGGVFFFSALAVSLVFFGNISGFFSLIPNLPDYIKAKPFTPIGGMYTTLTYLVIALPLGVNFALTQKDIAKKIFSWVSILVVGMATLASLYYILPGKVAHPTLPSFGISWGITIETFKNSPLWGAGPGNYLEYFNRFRSNSFNQTELWALRFTTANSFYLTLITEVGLGALFGLGLFFVAIYRHFVKEFKRLNQESKGVDPEKVFQNIALLLALVFLLIFPGTIISIATFFLVLSLASESKIVNLKLFSDEMDSSLAKRIPSILVVIPALLLVAFVASRATKPVLAEIKFKNSLDYIVKNKNQEGYQEMSKAIQTYPFIDRYRSAFAQVNFGLANSVVTTKSQKKETLTEEERKAVTSLIQSAISEAKAFVALNPRRSGNWELLANTYRALIPYTKEVETFAIQSYTQAIALDPLNPNLRIVLGGVFYGKKDYDSAIESFRLAIALKPDLPNAHYNLAFAYRDKGELDKAIAEMTTVLSLVSKDSKDYEVAKKDLANIEAKKKDAKETGDNLTRPETVAPAIKPPIELPADANPPVPSTEPSPSPNPQ